MTPELINRKGVIFHQLSTRLYVFFVSQPKIIIDWLQSFTSLLYSPYTALLNQSFSAFFPLWPILGVKKKKLGLHKHT